MPIVRSLSLCHCASFISQMQYLCFQYHSYRYVPQPRMYPHTHTFARAHRIHAPNHKIIRKPHIKCSPPLLFISFEFSRSLSPFHCLHCHVYEAHQQSRWSRRIFFSSQITVQICVMAKRSKPKKNECKEKKMTYHI